MLNESPLVEGRDLHRMFDDGRVQALRGVNLRIGRGECVAIAGPSGCGKSTLLQILGALDQPSRGEVFFQGESLQKLKDPSRFRARCVGFIFQSFHLLPTLSAAENVELPMFEMPWSARRRRSRALDLLEAVDLRDRGSHLPQKLSGGERQRVAIARSLANEPQLLLADEPTGNLDSKNALRIIELLLDLQRKQRTTLVLVTHDPTVAARSQRIIQMLDGRIASNGSSSN